MNKKPFKFVPIYGTTKQISDLEKTQGQFIMAEEGKLYFDKDEENRILISSKDSNFIYDQNSPSSRWNICHNLGKLPNVMVIDSAGTEVKGDIIFVDNNNIILQFSAEFSGRAILN